MRLNILGLNPILVFLLCLILAHFILSKGEIDMKESILKMTVVDDIKRSMLWGTIGFGILLYGLIILFQGAIIDNFANAKTVAEEFDEAIVSSGDEAKLVRFTCTLPGIKQNPDDDDPGDVVYYLASSKNCSCVGPRNEDCSKANCQALVLIPKDEMDAEYSTYIESVQTTVNKCMVTEDCPTSIKPRYNHDFILQKVFDNNNTLHQQLPSGINKYRLAYTVDPNYSSSITSSGSGPYMSASNFTQHNGNQNIQQGRSDLKNMNFVCGNSLLATDINKRKEETLIYCNVSKPPESSSHPALAGTIADANTAVPDGNGLSGLQATDFKVDLGFKLHEKIPNDNSTIEWAELMDNNGKPVLTDYKFGNCRVGSNGYGYCTRTNINTRRVCLFKQDGPMADNIITFDVHLMHPPTITPNIAIVPKDQNTNNGNNTSS